ncbi:MAG: hypothetical protein QM674_05945 [Burkholderiaceae bacterium]
MAASSSAARYPDDLSSDIAQINDDNVQARIASGELPQTAGDSIAIAADNGRDGLRTTEKAALVSAASSLLSTSNDAKRLFGPGVYVMDGLWNMNIQRARGNDTVVSVRFRAPYAGSISSVRMYWSDGSGYAGGNGGDIALRVLPDDGSARHLPNWSATPLATGRRVPGSLSMSNGTYTTISHRFSQDSMSSSQALEAGKLYHLVAINNASNPSSNWSSWDMAWATNAGGRPSRWISPYEMSALLGYRSAGSSATPTWEDWTVDGRGGARIVPIMQMTMSNGSTFGHTNMETGNVDAGGRQWKNGNGNPVRERYVPTQSRRISGLSIHTAKASGSGGLGWQIMQGTTVLASGTISQDSANYRVDSSQGSTGVMAWYDAALPSAVQLNANQTYDVVFTPQGSSVWVFADQRNGSSYGFTGPAAFTQSQAQAYTNGRWLNANHWSKSSSSAGSNWRVVLHQAD